MDFRDLKLRIATDNATLRSIFKHNLKAAGHTDVGFYDNAESVYRLAKADPSGLIVSDYELRDKSGLELLKDIRQDELTQDMPFILISSQAEQKYVAQAGELRVSAYLVKPFTPQNMLDKIKLILTQLIKPRESLKTYFEADKLSRKGKQEEALEAYKKALEANNNSMAAIYHKIGSSYEHLSREPEAENNYHQAADRSESYIEPVDALGNMYFKREEYAKAVDCYEKGVAISPLNTDRQEKLGEALLAAAEYKKAEAVFRSALESAPGKTKIYGKLGVSLMKQNKQSEAEQYLLRARNINEDADISYNLAKIFFDKGDKKAAVKHLEKALAINPDYGQALELLKNVT